MNKYNYRVIFSEALRTFIAVAEYSVTRKKRGGVRRVGVSLKTKPLHISALSVLIVGLFGEAPVVHAQMVAYKNGSAPQVIIDRSASGKPVLQIVNPNAQGLSHNQYDQFNVDGGGAVLNNSPVDVNTQLAGYVQGNPQLGAPARIILNEVMSTSRSALNGYLEVAGQRAEVIVANPNGISIGNGAGFINTSRAMVTTGKPVFGGDGSLAAFRVTQGDITVNSGGLTAVQTDQLDLMARNIQINDAISANQLNVLAGANQINYATLGVTVIPGVNGQPTLAVDSSTLGGMYAQKIRFVSTEQGLGVNLNGNLVASAGSMSLNSAGQLTLNANTNATGQIAINAQGDIINTGTLYGQSDVAITSSGNLTNTGAMLSSSDMTLYADSLTSTGLVGAGVNGDGETISGNLSQTNTSANGGLSIASNTITNNGGTLVASGRLALNGHGQHSTLNNNQGRIQSNGALSIAMDSVSNQGGQIETNSNGSTLSITADSIDNTNGRIANASNGATNLAVTHQLINQNGLLGGNGDVNIAAAYLNNTHGRSIAGGDLDLNVVNLANQGGTVYASGNLTLDEPTGIIDNTNGTLSAGQNIALASSFLNNTGGTIATAQGDIAINQGSTTPSTIINTDGHISAAHDLGLTANQLVGDGVIIAGNNAAVSLKSNYTNTANNLITANNVLTFTTTGSFTNQGAFSAGQGLKLYAAAITNNVGALINSGLTQLVAQSNLWNQGRIYGDAIILGAIELLNDSNAVIASRGTLGMGARTITNQEQASMISMGDMTIGGAVDDNGNIIGQAQSVTNASATIDVGGDLLMNAANLTNTNNHFETDIIVVSTETITEYSFDGNTWYTLGNGVRLENNGHYVSLVVPGRTDKNFWERIYVKTVKQTNVTSTQPAQILANGAMQLNVGLVNNNASVIVANLGLGGEGDYLYNNAPQGTIYTTMLGEPSQQQGYRFHSTERCGLGGRKECDNWSGHTLYSDSAPNQTINLPIWLGNPPPRLSNPADGDNPNTTPIADAPSADLGNGQTIIAPDGRLPGIKLPTNQLFIVRDDPNQNYLVETDPAFTNYDTFLSSDYMLSRLGMNPSAIQKRLGDGYYEQSLVQNQILQLTGKTLIDGYSSNNTEYQALMNNGVTYAQEFNLTPGVALTAEQMAALTSDMVWLVNQTVTLPDGSTMQVLAPVVYLAKAGSSNVNLSPTGSLIAGQSMSLNYQNVANSGTLQASGPLIVNANTITNSGTIQSRNAQGTGTAVLIANKDIISSGAINANQVALQAGDDVNLISATSTVHANNGDHTGISQVSTINADQLQIQAGHDVNLNAASIATTGDAQIAAANNLNIGAVTTRDSVHVDAGSTGHANASSTQTIGSQITSNNLTLAAGNDLNATASYVNTTNQLITAAGHDININAGEQSSQYDMKGHSESSGFLSSSSMDVIDKGSNQQALSSTLSGDKVTMVAGNNLNVTASNVASTNDMLLAAGNNLNVNDAQNTNSRYYQLDQQQSGLMSSGGVGVTIGSQSQSDRYQDNSTIHQGSLVGSVSGNVTLKAGNDLGVQGSNVVAAQDINLIGRNVTVSSVQDTINHTEDHEMSQSGLTIGLSSPITNVATSVGQSLARGNQVDDSRLKNLYAADAATTIYTNLNDMSNEASQLANGKTDSVSLTVSVGGSHSESHSQSQLSAAQGSQIQAGGNLNVIATGNATDPSQGNITVTGSTLNGKNIALAATNDIVLQSAQNTANNHATNSSSGWSAGVGISLGSTTGLTFSATAQEGSGHQNGQSTAQVNTQVNAANQLTIVSGRDTTLDGAIATGEHITADIGRNLTITSTQDAETYNASQHNSSMGASITYGPTGWNNASVSISGNQSKTNADYASVNQQSGLYAGTSGFDVNVGSHTQLNGGIIASTATPDKNNLSTGSLATTDITNHKSIDSEASGYGVGLGTGPAIYEAAKAAATSLLANASEQGSASSQTKATISAGNVVVRDGDTGALNTLNRDASVASGALQNYDVQGVAQHTQNSSEAGMVIANIGGQFADKAAQALVNNNTNGPKDSQVFRVVCQAEPCAYDPAIQTDPNRVDSEGNPNVVMVQLTQDQVANLSDVEKKNIVIATNGIMNDVQRAGEIALQNADSNSEEVRATSGNSKPAPIVVTTPPTGNVISDLLASGYEKFGSSIFGYSDAATTLANTAQAAGVNGVTVSAHSRGSEVANNALKILADRGVVSDTLQVQVNGPIVSQDEINATTSQLRSSQQVADKNLPQYNAFSNDFVSTAVGRAPNGDLVASLREMGSLLFSATSSHSCYGTGAPGCAQVNKPYSYGGINPSDLQAQHKDTATQLLTQGKQYDRHSLVGPVNSLLPSPVYFQKLSIWGGNAPAATPASSTDARVNQLHTLLQN